MRAFLKHRLAVLLAIPLGLGVLAGCGPYRGGQAGGELAARLYFTNESIDQAAVYAVGPGLQEIRIGTVMAGRTDTLSVPASLVGGGGNVHLLARPLARSFVASSGPITLYPGEELAVRLPSDQRTLVVLPPR